MDASSSTKIGELYHNTSDEALRTARFFVYRFTYLVVRTFVTNYGMQDTWLPLDKISRQMLMH